MRERPWQLTSRDSYLFQVAWGPRRRVIVQSFWVSCNTKWCIVFNQFLMSQFPMDWLRASPIGSGWGYKWGPNIWRLAVKARGVRDMIILLSSLIIFLGDLVIRDGRIESASCVWCLWWSCLEGTLWGHGRSSVGRIWQSSWISQEVDAIGYVGLCMKVRRLFHILITGRQHYILGTNRLSRGFSPSGKWTPRLVSPMFSSV